MSNMIGRWVSTDQIIIEVSGETPTEYIGREIIQNRVKLKYGKRVKILKSEVVDDEEED